ncbi:LOW QUALITY PROTEIN: serine protease 27-like [Dromiciops gliroides]|uniref:LOW QUALITY PROTEIN: serine protease 27-like n=1 Tax=Dromiciops gliroides TaxID=33562 RepID=UPI001CC592B2|nr:LOW QUALITY PROTEIN: serine protease 27-like [Dromiciops gliroides]
MPSGHAPVKGLGREARTRSTAHTLDVRAGMATSLYAPKSGAEAESPAPCPHRPFPSWKTMCWASLALLLPLLVGALGYNIKGLNMKEVCGRPHVSERILEGLDTSLLRWPWQAKLVYKTSYWCGATLISPNWVLTAAHCFRNQTKNPQFWKVQLGSKRIRPHQLNANQFYHRPLSKIVLYPYYKRQPSKDIALAKMSSPIPFRKTIQPICLPTSLGEFQNVTSCWVTGWGRRLEGQVRMSKRDWLKRQRGLQEIEVPLINQKTCDIYYQERLGTSSQVGLGFDDMFCAGFSSGKRDTCQGDSGGPLSCKVNGTWRQAGIVIWELGCDSANLPGVYTNVSIYTPWILKTINSSTPGLHPSGIFCTLPLLLPWIFLGFFSSFLMDPSQSLLRLLEGLILLMSL